MLGLVVGNSRLHWGWFLGKKLYFTWDSRHLPEDVILQIPQCQTLDELITLTTGFSFPSHSRAIYCPPAIFSMLLFIKKPMAELRNLKL